MEGMTYSDGEGTGFRRIGRMLRQPSRLQVVRVFRRLGAGFAAGVPVASTPKGVEELWFEDLASGKPHVEWAAPEVPHRLPHRFSPP